MDISPEGLREMFRQRAAADEELRQQELSDLEDEVEEVEADEPREVKPPRGGRKLKPEPKAEPKPEPKPEPKFEKRPEKETAPSEQPHASQMERSAAAFARIEASLRTIDKGLDLKLDEERKAREARYDREGEALQALGTRIEENVISALEEKLLAVSKEHEQAAQGRMRTLVMLGILNLAAVVVAGVLSILLR